MISVRMEKRMRTLLVVDDRGQGEGKKEFETGVRYQTRWGGQPGCRQLNRWGRGQKAKEGDAALAHKQLRHRWRLASAETGGGTEDGGAASPSRSREMSDGGEGEEYSLTSH